jgi:ribosomal protein S18 acetylase RimI-like enzyme
MVSPLIRPAERRDAAAIVILGDIAGYGLPIWLWANSAERGANESALAFGRRRVLREDTAFSYRNAHVAEIDGEVVGVLLGYRQPNVPDSSIPEDVPAFIRPLLQLEALAPATWYVNVLSVFEEFRGRGIGLMLLDRAEHLAAESDAKGLSLIVEDDNAAAIGLYERAGFRITASCPFVGFPGCAPAERWLLMVKGLGEASEPTSGRRVHAEGAANG